MKKVLFFLVMVFITIGFVSAQETLVLFQNGRWLADLGNVSMSSAGDNNKTFPAPEIVNNKIRITFEPEGEEGAHVYFVFEKMLNASRYNALVIEFANEEIIAWIGMLISSGDRQYSLWQRPNLWYGGNDWEHSTNTVHTWDFKKPDARNNGTFNSRQLSGFLINQVWYDPTILINRIYLVR